MKFLPAPLEGAFIVETERIEDERGFFARSFCTQEFVARGLEGVVAQCSISYNRRAGTLRGLHFQVAPHAEAKLVRCTSGEVFDVIVDLRESSPSRYRWFGMELSAANRTALYVPRGFAHGFQSLADHTEVLYQISEFHRPEAARGLRWDDPRLAIRWPLPDPIVSERDRAWPGLEEAPG